MGQWQDILEYTGYLLQLSESYIVQYRTVSTIVALFFSYVKVVQPCYDIALFPKNTHQWLSYDVPFLVQTLKHAPTLLFLWYMQFIVGVLNSVPCWDKTVLISEYIRFILLQLLYS